jgi:predicted alpha/beta superfamily hydrolase
LVQQNPIQGSFFEIQIDRSLWIYLPPSYDLSAKRYPVIYLQDGKRLIDPQQCNNLQIFENLFQSLALPEFIIVGLETANRNDEYTPWKSTKDSHLYGEFGGQGDVYMRYLAEIVKARIDQRYRTLADRIHTMIIGCSLGGLIAIYGGLMYPKLFGMIGGLSSSVWFEDFHKFVSELTPSTDLRLYLDVSRAEGKKMLQSNQDFYDLFIKKGFSAENLHFLIAQHGKHTTEYFIKRLPYAIEWLFSDIKY